MRLNSLIMYNEGVVVSTFDYLWGKDVPMRPETDPDSCTMHSECQSYSCKQGKCESGVPSCPSEPDSKVEQVPQWCHSHIANNRGSFSSTTLKADLIQNDAGPIIYTIPPGVVFESQAVPQPLCIFPMDGLTLRSPASVPVGPNYSGNRTRNGCGDLASDDPPSPQPRPAGQSYTYPLSGTEGSAEGYFKMCGGINHYCSYPHAPSTSMEFYEKEVAPLYNFNKNSFENNETVQPLNWLGKPFRELPFSAFLGPGAENVRAGFKSFLEHGDRIPPIVEFHSGRQKFYCPTPSPVI